MTSISQPSQLVAARFAPYAGPYGLSAARSIHWLLAALLIATALPTETSLMLGSVRMSPYRFVLVLAFFPCLAALISGRAGRMVLPDYLMGAHGLWVFASLIVNAGLGPAVEPGGSYLIEAYGSYLVARVCIRNIREFRAFCAFVVIMVMAISLVTLPEMLTGKYLIHELFAQLRGKSFHNEVGARFGLHRAYGPFDHPILWGVFASTPLAMSWFALTPSDRITPGRVTRSAWVWLGAMTSVSTGALACLAIQGGLIAYEMMTRWLVKRWVLLLAVFGVFYAYIGALSNRSAMQVFLSYLTFSKETAFSRVLIFDWGMVNVRHHPIFGIGLSDWERLSWMSPSFDNFWLYIPMRYGIPAFATLALSLAYMWWRIVRYGPRGPAGRPARFFTTDDGRARLAWGFSMLGLSIASATVHLWNSSAICFYLMIGAGVWMTQPPRRILAPSPQATPETTHADPPAAPAATR